jgi:hypothetical protein
MPSRFVRGGRQRAARGPVVQATLAYAREIGIASVEAPLSDHGPTKLNP